MNESCPKLPVSHKAFSWRVFTWQFLRHSMRVWYSATIMPEFQLFPCHPSGMGARTTQIPDFGKILYRHVHAQHHKSYLPTAFSRTNMHPVEVTIWDVQNGFLVRHQNPKIFPTGRPYGKLPFFLYAFWGSSWSLGETCSQVRGWKGLFTAKY